MENMMPYVNVANEKDFLNMDTLERIRSVSESSMGGTSGYNSTTSPGPENSPNSSRYSPVQSPDSILQNEFSQLVIPPISYQQTQQNSSQYVQLQNVQMNLNSSHNNNNQQAILYQQPQTHNQNMNFSHLNFGNPINFQQQQQFQQPMAAATSMSYTDVKYEYEATLRITEQPVEKFRFRYKSEMHGTHGSLNGTNSQRNTKTFPEVELCGYKGPAIIRCSLFQTNRESPHSHQLVVRKDDHDICDPHELKVSEEVGYFAEFKNMGIIHTAKKFIVEELLKKKRKRLGREVLTTKEDQELYKQTEKEAKDMNLNQVRLCFEAFRIEDNKSYTPIAAPVYSNPINNRKSAQTGELRITRLSIATGNVAGGDDLILLVEKVSKKNIKVRFYEMVDDEQVWEAFATFRESDVHHQYAIVCRTPAYKDKDIDKAVEVFIELVRPSDDERSYPPVSFRYKPSAAVISRKRRRTCSSFNSGSCSNSGSLSSGELPKTIQETQKILNKSDELKELLNSGYIKSDVSLDSGLLAYLDDPNIKDLDSVLNNMESGAGRIERDGVCTTNEAKNHYHYKKSMISKKQMDLAKQQSVQHQQPLNLYLQRILTIFQDTIRSSTPANTTKRDSAAEQITKIINEHSEKYGESLIHEIVLADNNKYAIPIFKVLDYFNLNELLNTLLNKRTQTALHYACLYGQPTYIRPLLKLGCNPNIQDSEGNTALHIAVHEKHLKCLESFINSEMPLNLNHLNDDGFTPLHLAIRDNNYDIVAKLLKFDASTVATPCSKDGSNALHMAVQQQNLKLVNLILDNSPLIATLLYANNRAGHTPLDLAKQLVTADEQGKQILSLLMTFYNKYPSQDKAEKMDINTFNDDEDGEHKLVIKEEENSCSSTEDDEEDNSSNLSATEAKTISLTPTQNKLIKPVEIKQEIVDDNITITTAPTTILTVGDLELALNNKDIFSKLSAKLNENENWKKMATAMEMTHFYLTNAPAFLNYLKRNIKTVNCTQFTAELEKIDKSLINLLLNN
ncbi:nuclear factor NF-kappa-B p110 subunit [Lucilia cuprina]|uniref:nuclear factor NF-kappa-B p110 subunit n=1 Tax=Lucilia cuprina TaxID=7375 RepID=UPI001F070524|nr:nuclear factor NF-kappa-B p110 subunit [Lucilia cuprina]